MLSKLAGSLRKFWHGAEPRYFPPETRLRDIPSLCPSDFVDGVELFNDPTTPMPFVVEALVRHCALSQQDALKIMLTVHLNGGALIPISGEAEAIAAAAAIAGAARTAGHPLLCRPSLASASGHATQG